MRTIISSFLPAGNLALPFVTPAISYRRSHAHINAHRYPLFTISRSYQFLFSANQNVSLPTTSVAETSEPLAHPSCNKSFASFVHRTTIAIHAMIAMHTHAYMRPFIISYIETILRREKLGKKENLVSWFPLPSSF